MSFITNKGFWLEFIALYESLPVLWNVKSKDYFTRPLKDEAYSKMVRKLQEIEPTANRKTVAQKINILRTNYNRVRKQMKQNEEISRNMKPTLWYYDHFRFLDDTFDAETDKISIKSEHFHSPLTQESNTSVYGQREIPSNSNNDSYEPPPKRMYVKKDDSRQLLTLLSENPMINNDIENDTSMLSAIWASQYNELSDVQKIFARKAISDILFYGCLGRLSENVVQGIHALFNSQENMPPVLLMEETHNSPFSP